MKHAGRQWMQAADDRTLWQNMREANVQQWTAKD